MIERLHGRATKIVSTHIFVGLPGRRPLCSRVSPRARGFSCAHYFQASATQAILVSKVGNCSLNALVLFLLFIYLFIFICSTDIRTALIGVGLVVKDEKSGLASLEKGAL